MAARGIYWPHSPIKGANQTAPAVKRDTELRGRRVSASHRMQSRLGFYNPEDVPIGAYFNIRHWDSSFPFMSKDQLCALGFRPPDV